MNKLAPFVVMISSGAVFALIVLYLDKRRNAKTKEASKKQKELFDTRKHDDHALVLR